MTITGDESHLYKEIVNYLYNMLKIVRLNAKTFGDSDLIQITDEVMEAFAKYEKESREEWDNFRRKMLGTCPACGGVLEN